MVRDTGIDVGEIDTLARQGVVSVMPNGNIGADA